MITRTYYLITHYRICSSSHDVTKTILGNVRVIAQQLRLWTEVGLDVALSLLSTTHIAASIQIRIRPIHVLTLAFIEFFSFLLKLTKTNYYANK